MSSWKRLNEIRGNSLVELRDPPQTPPAKTLIQRIFSQEVCNKVDDLKYSLWRTVYTLKYLFVKRPTTSRDKAILAFTLSYGNIRHRALKSVAFKR